MTYGFIPFTTDVLVFRNKIDMLIYFCLSLIRVINSAFIRFKVSGSALSAWMVENLGGTFLGFPMAWH